MNARFFFLQDEDWQAVRPDISRDVWGKALLAGGDREVRIVVTRVGPGGEFSSHRDSYHHVFYFFQGEGEGWVNGETYSIAPGRVAEIPAGAEHGYRNSSSEDLLLMTVNIPAGQKGLSQPLSSR